jgi:hypothetical protein
MAVTSTVIFQHANVEALMVTGSKPRFEIKLDGIVKESFPATRAWKVEKATAIAKAEALVVKAPVGARLDQALALCGVPLQQLGNKASRDQIVLDVTVDSADLRTLRLHGGNAEARRLLRSTLATYFAAESLTVYAGEGILVISEPAA